jgi:hypothetical protein
MGIVEPIWFQCFVLIFTLWNREIDHCIFPLSNKRFHVYIIGEILKFFLNGPKWGNESYQNFLWVCVRIEIAMNLCKEKRVGEDEWRRTSPSTSLSSSRKQRRRRFQLSESRRTQLNWRLEPPGVSIQYRVQIILKKT